MKSTIIVLIIIIIVGLVWFFTSQDKAPEGEILPIAEETIELEAIGDYEGSGVATREFVNGIFAHSVTAQISDPAPGKFYEGWLVKNPVTREFFSTGRMSKEGNAYTLNFTSDQNYPDHKTVVITEETEADGLDGNPEDHVLEGRF